MRAFIKHIVFYALALYLTTQIISGLDIVQGFDTLLVAALLLALFHAVLQPVFNIFLLPLNVLTFGLFSSVTTLVSVFLLVVVFHKVEVHPFKFQGVELFGLAIKPFFAGIILSYIIISVIIFAIVKFLKWVCKE